MGLTLWAVRGTKEGLKNTKKAILIVEDDSDIRDTLVEVLSGEGYPVHAVTQGQEALDYLGASAEMPSLIILDAMMPIMDGYTFRDLQSRNPAIASIPIAFLSADGHLEKRAQQAGLTVFIKKPVDLSPIFHLASRYCG